MHAPGPPMMAFGHTRRPPRTAEWLVIGGFVVGAVMIGAGGWLLRDTMVRHRATADETLRDHATYMSASFANSVQSQSWFAVRSLLRLAQQMAAPGARPIALDSVRALAEADAIGPGLPPLWPGRFLAGDSGSWRSTVAGVALDAAIIAAIERRAAAPIGKEVSYVGAVVARPGDTTLVFLERGKHAAWVGVEVPLASFRSAIIEPPVTRLAYAFNRLRDSLQLATGDSLPPIAVRISLPDSFRLFALGPDPAGSWVATRPILPPLGARATMAVLPAAVPVLMPGGYPPEPATRVALATSIAMVVLLAATWLAWRTVSLSRLREEFTSIVPHELRTPLTNIQLWAETLLLDRAPTAGDRRVALETITRETRRLVHMVENVLAFTRVGRASMALVRRPEELSRLLADATTSFEPLFRAHGITPDLTINGGPIVTVDGDAVRRILVNLIDNAVRYGPAGQTIRIGARHDAGWLELSVEDEGPGVAAADRERIWRPFERAAGAADGGTGIGLAVVRQLVTLHGGTAEVHSGVHGARFEIRLPVPPDGDGGST